mmetsp:Transcript_24583/g.27425  ORF Transcript_24583/g.27425 Transcript_24583/m.27425 type:complete len:86 (+) Transcript_24583:166-423(+)
MLYGEKTIYQPTINSMTLSINHTPFDDWNREYTDAQQRQQKLLLSSSLSSSPDYPKEENQNIPLCLPLIASSTAPSTVPSAVPLA